MPILGVAPYIERVKVKEPIHKAFVEGVEKTYTLSLLSLKALWQLITGGLSIKTLGGPIAIAQLAGESAQQGILPFIGMMPFDVMKKLFQHPLTDKGIELFLKDWEKVPGKPF